MPIHLELRPLKTNVYDLIGMVMDLQLGVSAARL